MSIENGTIQIKNDQQTKLAEAARANFNKTAEIGSKAADAARDGINKATDLHQAGIDKSAELGAKASEIARDGMSRAADIQRETAQNTVKIMRDGVETASQQAQQASERVARTLGFSGQDSEHLAKQSKQNMEAVTRCGTVLTQALQDASRSWFDLGQKQWQRNLAGVSKLANARSVQEFATVQSELVREGLQHMVQGSRTITETSLRAFDEAGKTFAGVAQPNASQGG